MILIHVDRDSAQVTRHLQSKLSCFVLHSFTESLLPGREANDWMKQDDPSNSHVSQMAWWPREP